ncbi:ryncolin-4 [Culex quinquefasciatus]|uniref:ryncolin-4 n=1 Tax=Culex quinquefasciatus TaxID=7176 RepID=UPI0018E2AED4|nr:ryncolin-4 [Culex quinquefasciatus]
MVLYQVTTVWLLLLATFSYGTPTDFRRGNPNNYDPVGNTFTIMSNVSGESFNRSWSEYRDGFKTQRGSNWIGLDKLHRLTNDGHDYQLIIVLFAEGATSYASCNEFKVDSEKEDYRVHCQSLPGYVEVLHDGSSFSTYDQGSGQEQAASFGFGWWFGENQKPFNAINMVLTKLKKKSSN